MLITMSLHCALLAPLSSTYSGKKPRLQELAWRSWNKDENYLKYEYTVDKKFQVQWIKASKSIGFQAYRKQYYFKAKKKATFDK